ncbi:unnamed protein product [Oppiella nova]|uniref:Uncharacterized protein n=1 Tax=Oppiella nova TaxID=334625 RepID=A0A7R9QHI3_9ACAR|nr:unnamed protein product [Oppiella nova]CAG2165118.1 unnamed protein product [Oppiella nova]
MVTRPEIYADTIEDLLDDSAQRLYESSLLQYWYHLKSNVHLYVFTCDTPDYHIPCHKMVMNGQLAAIDNTPMNYYWETQKGYQCSQPLYMSLYYYK